MTNTGAWNDLLACKGSLPTVTATGLWHYLLISSFNKWNTRAYTLYALSAFWGCIVWGYYKTRFTTVTTGLQPATSIVKYADTTYLIVSTGYTFIITYKPDRAACGKDGFWFIWERANFTPLQSRNYCTNQFQIVNKWLRRSDEENCQIS